MKKTSVILFFLVFIAAFGDCQAQRKGFFIGGSAMYINSTSKTTSVGCFGFS
jgi:hypothetical protein